MDTNQPATNNAAKQGEKTMEKIKIDNAKTVSTLRDIFYSNDARISELNWEIQACESDRWAHQEKTAKHVRLEKERAKLKSQTGETHYGAKVDTSEWFSKTWETVPCSDDEDWLRAAESGGRHG
jgi:hypothetical protein